MIASSWASPILILVQFVAAQSSSLQPAQEWSPERAAHLLRRAGFGGTPDQIQHLFEIGLSAAVDELVDYHKIPQTDPDYRAFEIPKEKYLKQAVQRFQGRSPEAQKEAGHQLVQAVRHLHILQMNDYRAWWIRRMIVTPRPLEEKMALFWHGHFTSGFKEVKDSAAMIAQNDFLRDNAVAKFRDLLVGVSQDPAMLRYLDNASNSKDKPNENYARELLELFCMGVGHYTEQDVREAARAFTGWTVKDGRFVVDLKKHDFGEKKFLGEKGNFDGTDIIDIIVRRNPTSRHLATTLLEFFVKEDPPDAWVDAFELEIRRKQFNMREVLRTLFRSELFYADECVFSLVKSPVELVVGTCRLLEIEPENPHVLALAADMMGQQLFQPPNVKGWDGGVKWINAATLAARQTFVTKLLEGGVFTDKMKSESEFRQLEETLEQIRRSMPGSIPGLETPKRFITSSPQLPYQPVQVCDLPPDTTDHDWVSYWEQRLLQQKLPDESKKEMETLFAEAKNKKWKEPDRDEILNRLIAALLSMPEYQVN